MGVVVGVKSDRPESSTEGVVLSGLPSKTSKLKSMEEPELSIAGAEH